MIASLIAFPRMFMRHARAFFAYTGRHLFALILLNIAMSYAEGIGIALFFPLLRSDGGQDALSLALASVIRRLHIDPSPTGVLPFIVATFVLKGLLMMGTYSYQGYLAARVPMRLRRDLVSALGRIEYRHVVGSNTGFQSNLLVNEVAKVGYAFTQFVRVFPPALNILVFFAIVLWLDWRLTLLCAGMGLCAVAVLSVAGRVSFQASKTAVKENATISSLIIQTFQSFKYLRSTAALGSFQRKIGESADRLARAEAHSAAASSLSLSIAQPLIVLFLAGLVYYRSAVQHEPLGSLFVLLLYLFRIMTELWALQFSWQSFVAYLGPTELVYSSLAELRKNAEPNGQRPYEGLKREIALREVRFAYTPDRPVLQGIDLRIACNSTVAFVGESGSGKSTLVDLVMGTLKPGAGSILVDGVPLGELDLESLRRRIGYVPQDALLFDDSVANNISLWSPATEAQILDAARRAKCLDFILEMPDKLAAPIGDRGVKLSGGQRQRLAIARELFKQPNILVLDEATSALDSESERAIKDSIDALSGQLTILIIAHRLSTIRNCEHICVLAEGRIVEEGSYTELLARPGSRFARLCQLQELSQDPPSAS